MKDAEHKEQREVVRDFRRKYKDVRIFAIPNGGHRNIAVATKLKAEGVSPGVPDLFIPEWGLWVEMKADKKNYLSEAQQGWKTYLEETCNYSYIVGYGKIDAMEKIERFLKGESFG